MSQCEFCSTVCGWSSLNLFIQPGFSNTRKVKLWMTRVSLLLTDLALNCISLKPCGETMWLPGTLWLRRWVEEGAAWRCLSFPPILAPLSHPFPSMPYLAPPNTLLSFLDYIEINLLYILLSLNNKPSPKPTPSKNLLPQIHTPRPIINKSHCQWLIDPFGLKQTSANLQILSNPITPKVIMCVITCN